MAFNTRASCFELAKVLPVGLAAFFVAVFCMLIVYTSDFKTELMFIWELICEWYYGEPQLENFDQFPTSSQSESPIQVVTVRQRTPRVLFYSPNVSERFDTWSDISSESGRSMGSYGDAGANSVTSFIDNLLHEPIPSSAYLSAALTSEINFFRAKWQQMIDELREEDFREAIRKIKNLRVIRNRRNQEQQIAVREEYR